MFSVLGSTILSLHFGKLDKTTRCALYFGVG